MSNVPKNKRNLSDMEFYHTAIQLRREVTNLLLRDFGVKDKVRNVNILSKMYDILPEDKEQLEALLTKYNMENNVVDEYPSWLIDYLRERILRCVNELIMNITMANNIYAYYESDYFDRRKYQSHAIGNCEQLIQLLQFAIDVLPVNVEKYMRYVELSKKEKALLKGWRKKENKVLGKIRQRDGIGYTIRDILTQIRDSLTGKPISDSNDTNDTI